MKKFISFPDIEQFRSVVHNVKHKTSYRGKDEAGNAIHDYTIPCPTLKFEGTVKLHGTNSAVAYDGEELWVQSRENMIDIEKDNAGFAMFMAANKEEFKRLFDVIGFQNKIVAIFGEWCGQGIQKGMAISSLPKMFVVFNIAYAEVNDQNMVMKTWLSKEEVVKTMSTTKAFKCIYDFPHWYLDVDFNNPHEVQNKLTEMTLAVEEECPVGKQLGAVGIGEGIVWKCISEGFLDSGFWFKVKGDKHSKTKVKTLAPVDVERINNIKELVEKLTPIWRLEQMCTKTFDTLNGGKLDIKGMGDFIKNTMQDILKEEVDTLAASGFTTKDITSSVAAKCRSYLSEQLNDFSK